MWLIFLFVCELLTSALQVFREFSFTAAQTRPAAGGSRGLEGTTTGQVSTLRRRTETLGWWWGLQHYILNLLDHNLMITFDRLNCNTKNGLFVLVLFSVSPPLPSVIDLLTQLVQSLCNRWLAVTDLYPLVYELHLKHSSYVAPPQQQIIFSSSLIGRKPCLASLLTLLTKLLL